VLGGAFNPPHVGHLMLAQEARFQLGLDRVIMIPTGRAPHKRIESDPGGDLRLEMARLAASGEPEIEVSATEVEAAARDPEWISYTYLTLEWLAESHPGELWLLLGADGAAGLPRWEKPERVAELARFGVAPRPGTGVGAVHSGLERIGAADRGEIIDMPQCSLSSSQIRKRAREGRPLRHLVPDPVIKLIQARGLYA